MTILSSRSSGLLMHISSLPSQYGIGDFGPGAYQFIDFLKNAKQHYWQILPLNPVNAVNGYSPYSSDSAFAGNSLFVSPELMLEDGFLLEDDLKDIKSSKKKIVDFKKAAIIKEELFDVALKRAELEGLYKEEFNAFVEQQAYWLEDYARYGVLKQRFGQKPWSQWDKGFQNREDSVLKDLDQKEKGSLKKIKFVQFLFSHQWQKLKDYAKEQGIKIIGDVPIYVSYDSADVWSHQDDFKLDDNNELQSVAGVPPDYFSATGQRWGNPIYDWDVMKEKGFDWWISRLGYNFQMFDMVRIDHFRGLVNFWKIPAKEKTAVNGEWMDVPYTEFFETLSKKFHPLSVIAEDLGVITDEVREVMHVQGFPGMKVLMFAFGGNLEDHIYLPHNYEENCVVYPGTHDNNTVIGWYNNDANEHEKNNFFEYIKKHVSDSELPWEMMKLAFHSSARLAIVALQDVCGLAQEARMNVPSTIKGNWNWRATSEHFSKNIIEQLGQLTQEANRDN